MHERTARRDVLLVGSPSDDHLDVLADYLASHDYVHRCPSQVQALERVLPSTLE